MTGIISYIKNSAYELKNHVSWTKKSEAQKLMLVVAVFSILFSLLIWGIDTLFLKVITFYFDMVN